MDRFTDFLVFEVGLDGQVVRLKNIQGPQKQKQEKAKEEPKLTEPKEGASEAAPAQAADSKEVSTVSPFDQMSDANNSLPTALDARRRDYHGASGWRRQARRVSVLPLGRSSRSQRPKGHSSSSFQVFRRSLPTPSAVLTGLTLPFAGNRGEGGAHSFPQRPAGGVQRPALVGDAGTRG